LNSRGTKDNPLIDAWAHYADPGWFRLQRNRFRWGIYGSDAVRAINCTCYPPLPTSHGDDFLKERRMILYFPVWMRPLFKAIDRGIPTLCSFARRGESDEG